MDEAMSMILMEKHLLGCTDLGEGRGVQPESSPCPLAQPQLGSGVQEPPKRHRRGQRPRRWAVLSLFVVQQAGYPALCLFKRGFFAGITIFNATSRAFPQARFRKMLLKEVLSPQERCFPPWHRGFSPWSASKPSIGFAARLWLSPCPPGHSSLSRVTLHSPGPTGSRGPGGFNPEHCVLPWFPGHLDFNCIHRY